MRIDYDPRHIWGYKISSELAMNFLKNNKHDNYREDDNDNDYYDEEKYLNYCSGAPYKDLNIIIINICPAYDTPYIEHDFYVVPMGKKGRELRYDLYDKKSYNNYLKKVLSIEENVKKIDPYCKKVNESVVYVS